MYERIPGLPVSPGSCHEYIVERSSDGKEDNWFRFTVIGRGDFPWDMLRFDRAYPDDTESALNLPRDPARVRDTREVKLVTVDARKYWLPNFERWKSFGWVVKSTVHEQ